MVSGTTSKNIYLRVHLSVFLNGRAMHQYLVAFTSALNHKIHSSWNDTFSGKIETTYMYDRPLHRNTHIKKQICTRCKLLPAKSNRLGEPPANHPLFLFGVQSQFIL